MTKKISALTMSGGGVLGLAHIGIVDALQDTHTFDFYSGVSAGAIVAAALACGYTPVEILEIIKKTNIFNMAFDFTGTKQGLVKGKKIHKLFQEIFENKKFEDLDSPLYIGATDFETGDRITINQGFVADAVRASMAVPGIFEPFHHPDFAHPLTDGGLSQNFPLDTTITHYSGNHIVGIDVAGIVHPQTEITGFFQKTKGQLDAVQRAFDIIFYNQKQHLPNDPRVDIIEPDLQNFTAVSIGNKHFQKLFEIGQQTGQIYLTK